jgi:UDP:flavonoid glycosyltransferase YjiC (YdhE family)
LRVYLAPCGIGLGHIARTYPIAQELNARHITTVFSTYLDGLDFAKQNQLPTYEAPSINFRVKSDGTIDFKRTAATSGFSLGIRTLLRQLVREIQYMKEFKPNVVFSDSRASSLLAARLLHIPVVLMLNQFRVEIIRRPSHKRLTLFDRLFFLIANLVWLFVRTAIELVWGMSKIILIPDLPNPNTISIGNLAIPKRYDEKIKLIGPIVENQYGNSLGGLRRNSKRPQVYAAISGPRIEREILAKILVTALGDLSGKYDIVVSKGNPQGKSKPDEFKGIYVTDWIRNQEDCMKASDVVVARAGHGTIMKSLAYGKPMLLIPIPDHTEQYGNARRAESLHVAKVLDQGSLDSATLDSSLQELLRGQYGKHAAKISESVSSLNAVQIACHIIENLAAH